MTLTLSTTEQARVAAAARALLSPLDLPDIDRWRAEVLARMVELVQADCGGFILARPGARPFTLHKLPDTFGREFFENQESIERGIPAVRRMGGGVWNTRLLCERLGMRIPADWFASEAYRRFYGRYGIRDGLGFATFAPYAGPDTSLSGVSDRPVGALLSCFRKDFGTEAFGERGLAIMRLLLPALEAGVATRVRLAGQEKALEHAFETANYGIAAYTLKGRRIFANAAHSRLMREDPEADRLRAAISSGIQAVADLGPLVGGSRPSQFDGGDSPRRLGETSRELRTRRARYALRLNLIGEGLFGRRPGILVALERLTPELPPREVLVERWRLTPQESRVALLLARGKSNRQIAEALDLSQATSRHYTEAVFLKLGVHSRAKAASKVLMS